VVNPSKNPVFRQQRAVEFHETDAAGLVHFTNLFRWMEAAELAFLHERDVSVLAVDAVKNSGWPRAAVRAEFLAPLRFGDKVETRLWLVKIGRSSIRYRFEIWRLNGRGGPRLSATGEITTVHVARLRGKLAPAPLPAAIRQKLK
jgi:YbgC/YbaW family acyl-CoA thioester hydrolase